MTYFSLIPGELLLELSLYFNYRDSILYCNIWKCSDVRFWLNKIRKELGYSDEFIAEYVYDTRNNTMKTLLPINEKYLELKARKSIDFGCEFYGNILTSIVKSSRIKDFRDEEDITLYLLQICKYKNADLLDRAYGYGIRGAIAVNNIKFADKLISQYLMLSGNNQSKLNFPMIAGIYENGDLSLLDYYKIDRSIVSVDMVISGLASAGNLAELKNYEQLLTPDNLFAAVQLGRVNVVERYRDLLFRDPEISENAIRFGHINLLPDVRTTPTNVQREIMAALITNGYLEELVKYRDLITYQIVYENLLNVLVYNHVDVLNFLYSSFGERLKSDIRHMIAMNRSKINKIGVSMFEYLFSNNIIRIDDIINVSFSTLSLMKKFNDSALEYLLSLPL